MKTPNDLRLDGLIQVLQNLPTFAIYGIDPTGQPVPWWEVTGLQLAEELVVREADLAYAIQSLPAKILEWGVLGKRAARIHAIEERLYRAWKARIVQASTEKLTGPQMEALYRAHADYDAWNVRLERAREAADCAQVVLDAFREKAALLRASVRPAREATMSPTFGIP